MIYYLLLLLICLFYQGSEQLGCKLHNTRKWIGATEVVTVLSWLRINCQLIDFHRPTSTDGRHPELFNWVLRYFEEPKVHSPPLYLQHQGIYIRSLCGIVNIFFFFNNFITLIIGGFILQDIHVR